MSGNNMKYTVGQLAHDLVMKQDTLRVRLRRKYGQKYPGQSWGHYAVVPDEIVAELLDKSGEKKERKERTKVMRPARSHNSPIIDEFVALSAETVPDTSKPANLRGYALSVLLIGIVLGHAGLVWYDCAQLWATPGAIAGGLVFAVVLAAVMLSSDTTKGYTADICMYFVFFVDVAAFWVHKPVFSGYGVDNATTNALCCFVCATSFAALFIFKSYKND